jgi:hypothetical protein
LGDRLVACESRDVERGSAVAVARVQVRAGLDEPAQLGRIAARRRGMKAAVGGDLGRGRRGLGLRAAGEEERSGSKGDENKAVHVGTFRVEGRKGRALRAARS